MQTQSIGERATIHITNLALRTIIGLSPRERSAPQDILINLSLQVDARRAVLTDDVRDSLDYKEVRQQIIATVERSSSQLLESLTHAILATVMENPAVLSATVRVDKPHALRYADSVAVEMQAQR
jgi:D-erythro-7,8-dihydroneopterin triphosphate epimerase